MGKGLKSKLKRYEKTLYVDQNGECFYREELNGIMWRKDGEAIIKEIETTNTNYIYVYTTQKIKNYGREPEIAFV